MDMKIKEDEGIKCSEGLLRVEKLRERHFEQILTVTQLIEQEDEESHIFESILQIMLSYAKFGEIKYGDEPLSDERIQAVFGLITDIDSALMSRSGKDRLNVIAGCTNCAPCSSSSFVISTSLPSTIVVPEAYTNKLPATF